MKKANVKIFSIAILFFVLFNGCNLYKKDSEPDNNIAIANAGVDQTVGINNTVQLDGSGSSDIDNDNLSYKWTIKSAPTGSVATLSDSTIVNPTILPLVAGDYIFSLVVNDGSEDSTSVDTTITVKGFIGTFNRLWVENGETYGAIPKGTNCKQTFFVFIGDGNTYDFNGDNISDITAKLGSIYIIDTDYTISGTTDTIVWQKIIEDDTPANLSDAVLHKILESGTWSTSGGWYDAFKTAIQGVTNSISADGTTLIQTSAGGATINKFTRQ